MLMRGVRNFTRIQGRDMGLKPFERRSGSVEDTASLAGLRRFNFQFALLKNARPHQRLGGGLGEGDNGNRDANSHGGDQEISAGDHGVMSAAKINEVKRSRKLELTNFF